MCVSPVVMVKNGNTVTYECNRCFECVRKRKLHWQIRLHSELTCSDKAFFSLLSYNEENYPDPDNYDVNAIQLLIKRLRQRLNRNFIIFKKDSDKAITLRYFIVSEYGEQRSRLHYHAIFFLQNVNDDLSYTWFKSILEETWQKGFCSAFELDIKTIVYTTKYIQKSYNMMLYSKSLGKDAYIKHNKDKKLSHGELDTYAINGKLHVVPRSWRNELRGIQFNTLSANKISNDIRKQPSKLSIQDRIMLNDSFSRDNPIDVKQPVKQDNSDLVPDGEF